MGLILIETQNVITRMPVGLRQWLAAASRSRPSVAVSEGEFNILWYTCVNVLPRSWARQALPIMKKHLCSEDDDGQAAGGVRQCGVRSRNHAPCGVGPDQKVALPVESSSLEIERWGRSVRGRLSSIGSSAAGPQR